MSTGGVIQFRGYRVVKIEYECSPNLKNEEAENVKISIAHNFQERENNSVQLNILVKAYNPEKGSDYDSSEMKMLVEIAGIFQTSEGEKWDEKWNANAIAILVPYARAFISSITAQVGRPPIILPTINTYALLN